MIEILEVIEMSDNKTTPDPLATIAADLAALTARVSVVETTANPTAAAALSEARRHLLRAAVAVELAQEATAWTDVADDMAAEAEQGAGGQEPPLKDIADAPCPECGAHAVSFADDLAFDEMILGAQGVVSVNIPNLTGIRCSNCGDHAFDADASKKIMQAVSEAESGGQDPQGKEGGAGA